MKKGIKLSVLTSTAVLSGIFTASTLLHTVNADTVSSESNVVKNASSSKSGNSLQNSVYKLSSQKDRSSENTLSSRSSMSNKTRNLSKTTSTVNTLKKESSELSSTKNVSEKVSSEASSTVNTSEKVSSKIVSNVESKKQSNTKDSQSNALDKESVDSYNKVQSSENYNELKVNQQSVATNVKARSTEGDPNVKFDKYVARIFFTDVTQKNGENVFSQLGNIHARWNPENNTIYIGRWLKEDNAPTDDPKGQSISGDKIVLNAPKGYHYDIKYLNWYDQWRYKSFSSVSQNQLVFDFKDAIDSKNSLYSAGNDAYQVFLVKDGQEAPLIPDVANNEYQAVLNWCDEKTGDIVAQTFLNYNYGDKDPWYAPVSYKVWAPSGYEFSRTYGNRNEYGVRDQNKGYYPHIDLTNSSDPNHEGVYHFWDAMKQQLFTNNNHQYSYRLWVTADKNWKKNKEDEQTISVIPYRVQFWTYDGHQVGSASALSENGVIDKFYTDPQKQYNSVEQVVPIGYKLVSTTPEQRKDSSQLLVYRVVRADSKPVFKGNSSYTITVNDPNFNLDNLITARSYDGRPTIVTHTGNFDKSKPGVYKLIYSTKDREGNQNSMEVTVNVEPAPIIKGENQTIVEGAKFDPMAAVTATNYKNQEINVSYEGNVDTNKPGTYTLTYIAKDDLGGVSTKKLTVTVVKKDSSAEKPSDAKPAEPSKPAEKPSEPAKPVEPNKPVEKPSEPAKPAEPSKPAEKPSEPAKPAEPSKPVEKPSEPAKPVEPSKPAEKPSESAKPEQTNKPGKSKKEDTLPQLGNEDLNKHHGALVALAMMVMGLFGIKRKKD